MENVNFTERELSTILEAVNARLTDISLDEELQDIVGRFEIAHMIDVVEKCGKPDWAEEYRKEFDWIDFSRMNYKK